MCLPTELTMRHDDHYLSPETRAGGQWTTMSDIFALGVMIVELGCRRAPKPGPFRRSNSAPARAGLHASPVLQAAQSFQSESQRRMFDLNDMSHPQLRQIAEKCLSDSPADRPSAQELVASMLWLKESPQYQRTSSNPQRDPKLADPSRYVCLYGSWRLLSLYTGLEQCALELESEKLEILNSMAYQAAAEGTADPMAATSPIYQRSDSL